MSTLACSGGALVYDWNNVPDGTLSLSVQYSGDARYIAAADTISSYAVTSAHGSGSKSETAPAETTTTVTVETTTTATTTATAAIDSKGKATAAVTQSQIADAVNKAAVESAKQEDSTSTVIEIKVDAAAAAKTVDVSLPKTAMSTVADSNNALTVSTPIADITFGSQALDTIDQKSTDEIKVSATKVEASGLSEESRQVVGDRPVYNFSVTSGEKTISQFEGNVSISVPYIPKEGESTNSIIIYYINAEGKPEIVSNCVFDAVTKRISFSTNHFSEYAVGYNKVGFEDVSDDAWYSEAIGFIAARNITSGTDGRNFSPEGKLTRGQFMVMIMKAYGIAPDAGSSNNFADAGSTYYTSYLAAAKKLGISYGTGSNLFEPNKEITRQEMITLLYNALKVMDQLPQETSGKQMTAFSDSGQIASWAKDAMTLFAANGIISGNDGKILPTGRTTRAEMAQVRSASCCQSKKYYNKQK